MSDYDNFIAATMLLIRHIIPYGKVEFFAPPWALFFLLPFAVVPRIVGIWLWQLGTLLSIVTSAVLAIPKNRIYPLISLILPPTLLTLAVGQISAFIALASTILLVEVSRKSRLWLLLLCLFIASLKPNLAAVPTLIALIALAQRQEYRKLITIGIACLVMVSTLELIFPNIIKQWLVAMFSGAYSYGAPVPLNITLSNGISFPIGSSYFHAPPFIITLPLCVWFAYLYYREGLTPRNIALSLSIGFLFLPYYRLYDFVMLYYPIGYIVVNVFGNTRRPTQRAADGG